MGALGHRALLQYIESNDLAGFKAFLDTRNLAIDDRDEVREISSDNGTIWHRQALTIGIIITEWCHRFNCNSGKGIADIRPGADHPRC